jgi:hypothetical protein
MALQWRLGNAGSWYGYSGKFIAAWIVRISLGEHAGKWGWYAEFPVRRRCARQGNCASLALARRAANGAWHKFLAHAALKAE